MCGAVLRHRESGRGRLVNYDELPSFVCEALPSHFGVRFSAEELERMAAVSGADAKMPPFPYSDDRQAKRQLVTPELQALVEHWLSPAFERLEIARKEQKPLGTCKEIR